MTTTTPTDSNHHAETAEAGGDVSRERAERFYDRLRDRIHHYLETKGRAAGKAGDFLLLVPDFFILLWRLAQDPRVNAKNKVLLGSGIAYYIFPLDIFPEAIIGPIGYLDDLLFGVYMLNKMVADTDPGVLHEHWSGSEDVLQVIQRVLGAADSMLSGDLVEKIKKMAK
jgi:uncharacterized membrane protein YkvA (DUF1232 family)